MADDLQWVFSRAAVLPAGRVVHTPTPQSEKPQEMMIAFRIAPEVSGRYAQDDQEPLEDRHITLVYIPPLPADERAKVHDVVRHWLVESDWQPMDGQAQGWGTFNNGKGRVLWMGWDIPGMAAFRTDLERELIANDIKVSQNHDFVPHETVTYVKREITRIPKFPNPAPSQTFSSVVVAEGDLWTEYDFPAVGSLVAALSGGPTPPVFALDLGLLGDSTPGLDAALNVDLLRHGFQMVGVDAMQDSAEMVEVPLVLRAEGSIALGQRSDASLPDEAVGDVLVAIPDDAPVAVDGIDVSSPQKAMAEVGTEGGDRTHFGAASDGLLAGAATSSYGRTRVAEPLADLVVAEAKSERRVLDLPLTTFNDARSSGEGATLAFLENGSGERIAIDALTTVVRATEFLGEDGTVATFYGTDGHTPLASASLWVADQSPALVVSAAPASSLRRLRAAFDGAGGQWDSLATATKKKGSKGDGNKGNAEELREYWTTGEGGAKIRWGTSGDHERCVKYLKKYLGPGANGYCQLRHHEMTGMYTGDMKHRIMYGWGGKPGSYWAKKAAEDKKGSSITDAMTAGGDEEALMLMLAPPQAEPFRFHIPLVLPEGAESGDGRTFVPDSVSWRDLPLPLLWQPTALQGHDGSMIVGRIDSLERIEGGVGNAVGVFDTSPMAQEAVRMIRDGFLRGTSADLDQFEAKVVGKGPGTGETVDGDGEAAKKDDDGGESGDEDTIANDKMDITKGRIMAVTLVAKPAFQQCYIELVEPQMIEDGEYRVQIGAEEALAAVMEQAAKASRTQPLTAAFGGAPIYPPAEWFNDPGLTKPSRITVTDDGRVFGHIAAWHVDHIGMGFGVRPPKSKSNYAYFRTGLVRTAEGEDVRVGQLTLVGGHASLTADVKQTVKHYDDTASAWADVVAGEDKFGIWVAGSLRPTVTPEILRAARASAVSGDWRPINGKLELVAVCSVNVPGFPMVEARVASGQIMALVAAGTGPIMQDWAQTLTEMLLEEKALAARARMDAATKAIIVRPKTIREAVLSKQPVSTERRREYARKGWALDDGSYPIADEADLKRAIHAYGRSKPADRAKVRRHIIKRAKALGKSATIPEDWK